MIFFEKLGYTMYSGVYTMIKCPVKGVESTVFDINVFVFNIFQFRLPR